MAVVVVVKCLPSPLTMAVRILLSLQFYSVKLFEGTKIHEKETGDDPLKNQKLLWLLIGQLNGQKLGHFLFQDLVTLSTTKRVNNKL